MFKQIIVSALCAAPLFAQMTVEKINGYTSVLKGTNSPAAATWSFADGEIRCTGEPFGYLMLPEGDVENCTLTLEYRWHGKPVNSGIFIHKTGPDAEFLPKAIEVQLKKGRAGDFVLLSKATADAVTENPRIKVIPRTVASAEKPDGEWNTVEIKVTGPSIKVKINGQDQNEIKKAYTDKGVICLQSEGGEITFRNVKIVR